MKKSLILLELIVSILILSIVAIYALKFTNSLYHQNMKNLNLNFAKLDLESTQVYLEQNGLDNIIFHSSTRKLYANNQLLLEDVSTFNLTSTNTLHSIDICINKNYEICQKWIIKK